MGIIGEGKRGRGEEGRGMEKNIQLNKNNFQKKKEREIRNVGGGKERMELFKNIFSFPIFLLLNDSVHIS